MINIFKRKPDFEDNDEAMSDLSIMFHSFPQDPTFKSEILDPEKLDYSIQSLEIVDDYLDTIRSDNDIEDNWNKTALRCGAYVGEVIRRADKKRRWHWVTYETALEINPERWKDFEKSISSCSVLYQKGKSFCFPLGKVSKFLENGREDSVKYFAEVMIDKWTKE